MKSLVELLSSMFRDAEHSCAISTDRDIDYVTRRVDNEGISFLTITLPTFGSDLQKALTRGAVDDDLFLSFKKVRGGLPAFMQGFLRLVFDPETLCLRPEPDKLAIFYMRQISDAFKKISLPCSDARVAGAYQAYLDCERDVRRIDTCWDAMQPQLAGVERIFHMLYADTLVGVDELIDTYSLIPRHGPGVTADKLVGNHKFGLSSWPARLDVEFPYSKYGVPNERFSYLTERVEFPDPGSELPVRVITVPKTLKTPRIIAVEPTAMQYAQQALSIPLIEGLERSPMTRDLIGFTDQVPNQHLAMIGSRYGHLATLDLKEASDRVSNQLVRHLFSRYLTGDFIQSCRSRKADVNGKVIRLAKFASMGSALCFPVEAMVFLAIVLRGVEKSWHRTLSREDIISLGGTVRVYGDDIIVPVDSAVHVITELEAFGLLVNRDKSFLTGQFRESCGGDFFDGFDVTTVKVREVPPERGDVRSNPNRVVSAVSSRNQFYELGMWETARWYDDRIRKLIPFPIVRPTSPGLGRTSFLALQASKFCPDRHVPLVRACVVKPLIPIRKNSGEGALLKWFLKRGSEPFAEDHNERSGRPETVRLKSRWVTPF